MPDDIENGMIRLDEGQDPPIQANINEVDRIVQEVFNANLAVIKESIEGKDFRVVVDLLIEELNNKMSDRQVLILAASAEVSLREVVFRSRKDVLTLGVVTLLKGGLEKAAEISKKREEEANAIPT